MKLFSWMALILLIIGALGLVTGIKTNNAMLVAMSGILWIGCVYFDVLVLNEKMNERFALNVGEEKDE
jgi:hypothetical protein